MPPLDRTLSLHRALWLLMALHAAHAAAGDWLHPHLDTVAWELGA